MSPPSGSERGGGIEILTLGRRRFAFGLRWTSATSRASLVAEALAAARAEGDGHVALHRGFNQFGLARGLDADGLRSVGRPVQAGAAAIAEAVGTATLAAFPLEDGRWLVLAIDRKGILPDGDMIVAEAGAARARIDALIAQSPTSWRRKLVPADWNVPDSRSVDPRTLLDRSRAPRLTGVWLLAHRRRIVLGGLAASLPLAASVLLVLRHALTPPVLLLSPPPPKPVAAVWTPAGVAIERCLAALRDAQRFNAVPGWHATKYICRGGEGVTVDLLRTPGGQIGALEAFVPQAQLSDDGRSAVLALPLPSLPLISAISAFPPRQRYQLIGLDLAQRLNGAFTLQPSRRKLPGDGQAGPPNQAWSEFTWTYQTQAPAIVWAGAIARLGSISVETLSFSPADNLWQLMGSLYARN